ncbi:MAG: divalent-cation tolerance protein CutA, partial [Alphaproteobacteria bacterium]|nr:divalent-cation tolerance protein CutA [Alphaproteobacteria bacterium]
IIPGMVSVYRWDGKVTSDNEVVLIIKSQQSRVDKIIAEIESNHPYDVPAAVVLPVTAGSKAYLSWLLSETDAPTSHAG